MASEPHTDAGPAPANSDPLAAHPASAVDTLRQAMRRASVDSAERSGVVCDLRAARLARLGLLQDALQPLAAQIPRDVDTFEMNVLPGLTPRLFVDVVAFVEMGRDARVYRFFQDTRHGRDLIVESADVRTLVGAVTDYVARRLVERERALAGSLDEPRSAAASPARGRAGVEASVPQRSSPLAWLSAAFWFLIHVLGSVTFFLLLAFAGWLIWNGFHKAS